MGKKIEFFSLQRRYIYIYLVERIVVLLKDCILQNLDTDSKQANVNVRYVYLYIVEYATSA